MKNIFINTNQASWAHPLKSLLVSNLRGAGAACMCCCM
jgi:hypothetical protein